MFGPEGRPQHCCAWLGIASSFPECASPVVPEEVKTNPPELFYIVNRLVLNKVLKTLTALCDGAILCFLFNEVRCCYVYFT